MEKNVELFKKEEMAENSISHCESELRRILLKLAKDIQSIKWYLRFFVILTILALTGVLAVALAVTYKFMQ